MYYGNQECEIKVDLGNGEVVIEIFIGEASEGGSDEYAELYPCETKVIVNKRYITDEPLDTIAKVAESKQIIDDANREVNKNKLEANKQIKAEKGRLEDEIKALKARASAFKGLSEYVNFLEGKYNYVVYIGEYKNGIEKLDEIMCSCTKSELAAVSFRSNRNKKWAKDFEGWLYVNEYSDDSGSNKYRIKGFATIDEAKLFFGESIVNGFIKSSNSHQVDRILAICDRYEISNVKIEKLRADRAEQIEVGKQKKIKDLKAELVKANQYVTIFYYSASCNHSSALKTMRRPNMANR